MSKSASKIDFWFFSFQSFRIKAKFWQQKLFFGKDHYIRRILREVWKKIGEIIFLCAILLSRAVGKIHIKKT